MIRFYLAQIDLTKLFENLASQYGFGTALLIVVAFLLFLTYRAQLKAKNERDAANTLQIIEDTRRDALISNLAEKQGVTEAELRRVDRQLAESEGAVKLLNQQLNTERENRQREREELKEAMRRLSEKLTSYETRIEELQTSISGKNKEIGNLIIERDIAIDKLAEKEAQLARINANLDSTTNEVGRLNGVVQEQSEQIKVLSYELAALLPLPPPEKPPTLDDTIELKPEDLAEDPLRTLDNPSTQPLPIDIEDKKDEAA